LIFWALFFSLISCGPQWNLILSIPSSSRKHFRTPALSYPSFSAIYLADGMACP
jgi:hypothetical protein